MRIQAANTFYTGNKRSLFQFEHVTITEHMVNAKYGTNITNSPRIQMQTAGCKKPEEWVNVSKEELEAAKCNPSKVAMDAFEVLVRDQAAPQNAWSNTLYSEDGKFIFILLIRIWIMWLCE